MYGKTTAICDPLLYVEMGSIHGSTNAKETVAKYGGNRANVAVETLKLELERRIQEEAVTVAMVTNWLDVSSELQRLHKGIRIPSPIDYLAGGYNRTNTYTRKWTYGET